MRRLASSFLAILLTVAAVLPGAAAFAVTQSAPEKDACLEVDIDDLAPAVEASNLIVIGRVEPQSNGGARVIPEAFLEGAASSEPIELRHVEPPSECALVEFAEPARVLLFLHVDDDGPHWPNAARVFWLVDGRATRGDSATESTTEAELVRDIRRITEQYAVPADDPSEGAGIDWWSTIVPVGAASLGLLAVGFYLMRIWHRIDPS